MRVSVIGAGFGQQHLLWLAECPNVEVASLIFRNDRERAQRLASTFGIPLVSDSVDDAIEGDSDLLVVASPVNLHADLVERGLNAGKAVVCEKPLALDVESAHRMVRAAQASGQSNMTMFQWRFHPALRALRDALQAGDIGHALHVELQFHHDFLASHDTEFPWRHSPDQAAAGTFADQAVHLFDLLRWLTGQEFSVRGAASSVLWATRRSGNESISGGTEDVGSVLLQSQDGLLASVTTLRVTKRHRKIGVTVSGTENVARVELCPDDLSGRLEFSSAREGMTWPSGSLVNPYRVFTGAEGSDLAADIPDFADGLAAQHLLDAAASHTSVVLKLESEGSE
ncbi:Gfo/Idh/MocA family oxidoreductase [Streptomyces wedmorensis]|uniref:Gfo/Idh/MocA family protein n=1 Tax=Streptomyces wedmorensis TaxID=43759 RepID=UPI0034365087